MDLAPLFQRIIVKRKETRTSSGLIIPEGTKSLEATEGTVLAVGNECDVIHEGDQVFFGKYSGAEIVRGDEKYIVMNEEDVIARVVPVN